MANPNSVLTLEQAPQVPVETGSAALMRIIERAATSPDFDVEKLQKLLDVKMQWEATEARKAYVVAVAAFKADPPTVQKNKQVKFGKDTVYDHATLDQVCAAISPALSQHGLSHRWETEQHENQIKVTCVLTHTLGHSERVTLQSGPDVSGSKNSIQAIASATTYLCRYTLLMITGLATTDMDDDGREGADFVTVDQALELENMAKAMATELGKDFEAVKDRFLKAVRAVNFISIPASRYEEAKKLLAQKKREAK